MKLKNVSGSVKKKNLSCSWSSWINTVKTASYKKPIYRSNASSKFYCATCHRNRKVNIKIHMEAQKSPGNQNNLTKKNGVSDTTVPDFRLYYRATVLPFSFCCSVKHHDFLPPS